MFDIRCIAPASGRPTAWGSFSVALAGHIGLLAAVAGASALVVERVTPPSPTPAVVLLDTRIVISALSRREPTQEPAAAGSPELPRLGTPRTGSRGKPPDPAARPAAAADLLVTDLDPSTANGPPASESGGGVEGDGGSPFGVPNGTGTDFRGVDRPGYGSGPGEGSVLLNTEMEPPVLVEKVVPDYPEAARAARLTGRVFVRAVVSPEGDVVDVEAVSSSHPLFESAALDAVRKWKYRPARLNGRPVAVHFTVIVQFTLR
jgi:protein TonB